MKDIRITTLHIVMKKKTALVLCLAINILVCMTVTTSCKSVNPQTSSEVEPTAIFESVPLQESAPLQDLTVEYYEPDAFERAMSNV